MRSRHAPDAQERILSVLTAIALDLIFGEPPAALHPVVWLGAAIDQLEERLRFIRGVAPPAPPAARTGSGACPGRHDDRARGTFIAATQPGFKFAQELHPCDPAEGGFHCTLAKLLAATFGAPQSSTSVSAGDNELAFGAAAAVGLVAVSGAAAWLVESCSSRLPKPMRILVRAVALKPSFSLRGLLDAASLVRAALDRGDIDGARRGLRSLVSRPTGDLDEHETAAAAVESLAENTTDSLIGPWFAYLMFGLPGAWAFRTVNTLDSRWGYHGRYERLGRTAAVLDDVIAAVPARASAILLIAAAAVLREQPAAALRAVLSDRRRTESPNAGWTMAAMAGALGRRLAKRGHYALNEGGADCKPQDIGRAQRLVGASSLIAVALGALFMGRPKPR